MKMSELQSQIKINSQSLCELHEFVGNLREQLNHSLMFINGLSEKLDLENKDYDEPRKSRQEVKAYYFKKINFFKRKIAKLEKLQKALKKDLKRIVFFEHLEKTSSIEENYLEEKFDVLN